MSGQAYPEHEMRARSVKATRLLDAIAVVAVGVPLTGDVVRGLSDDAWKNAERLAGTHPSSETTRDLVAWLADTRTRIAKIDPFDGFPQASGR